MNELKLAGIIVRKRREKGITQEELAEHIGVSKAAVSKWETGQSYPDIVLLPHLAAFFNISIDELLNYSPQLTREDTQKIYQRLSADFNTKTFEDAVKECKAVVKKYFSCFPLLYQMAVLLANHYMLAGTQEKQDEALEDAKVLCKRIISESGNPLLSRDALYLECYICIALRRFESVFELIGESLQISTLTQDRLIAQAFRFSGNLDKAKEITQCGMYQYLTNLVESTIRYISITDDDFDTAETAFNRALALIRLYGVEKLNVDLPVQAYLSGAKFYCKHGYLEKALVCLNDYADLCVKAYFPFKIRGDAFFTTINQWIDHCDTGSSLLRDEEIVKKSMLQALTTFSPFAVLNDNEEYKRIIRKLTDLQMQHNN